MDPFQPCSDMSDLTSLSMSHQLYLKPEAKLNITVALPAVTLPGKTISNWEVMERLRQAAEPDQFQLIKVSKSTLEFIRFDGEIENRSQMQNFIHRLDGKVIRLSGFPEPLKVRAAEAKPDFPTRYDWDKFFRDAKNMNEMKAGERPDTVAIQGLPSKWFVSKRNQKNGSCLPCESALQKIFEAYGEVRSVDIPMLDPYRNSMKASISGIKSFSHTSDTTFDAFVQYREYISFVKAMDSLRGMKIVHKEGDKVFSASIKVDFDKTKHLSDMSIHRRRIERDKLLEKEREKEEAKRREEDAVRRVMEEEQKKKEEEKRMKGVRRKEREEKRKQRILKKLKKKEAETINIKIAIEERKLLMAQRKLESIRLLDELFERVKIERQKEITKEKEKELEDQLSKVKHKKEQKLLKKEEKESKKKDKLVDKEKELRRRLVKKIKSAQEQQLEERRERLRKIKIKDKAKAEPPPPSAPPHPHPHYDHHYDLPYDAYGGYGYPDWMGRGMYRGRYMPRRPPRGYRGSYHYQDWNAPRNNRDWENDDQKPKKSAADEVDEISSNAVSSATSDYSNLGSSDDEEKKKKEKKETWPGYEGMLNSDPNPTHPWVGYSDFYNPRFMRRGGRRPRGPFRGAARGGFGPAPNPNVPTNSFYMQSINEQYYRYFNKLAKGDDFKNDKRSRSSSSDRVVCRKVLSRSRSRGKSYSRSRSRSSRSRSRSHSRSRKRSASRSRSRSRKRSASRSRSRHSSTRKKSRSKSKSPHQAEKVEERNHLQPSSSNALPNTNTQEQPAAEAGTDVKGNKEEAGSDLSLSLSGSANWSSPERKAKPLGNPNWEPSDSRRFQRGRNYFDLKYSRFRPHYEDRQPQVRSLVSRAEKRSKSRSRSPSRNSRKEKSSRDREPRRSSSRHKSPSKRPRPSSKDEHRGKSDNSNVKDKGESSTSNKISGSKKDKKKKKKHEKKKKSSRSLSRE